MKRSARERYVVNTRVANSNVCNCKVNVTHATAGQVFFGSVRFLGIQYKTVQQFVDFWHFSVGYFWHFLRHLAASFPLPYEQVMVTYCHDRRTDRDTQMLIASFLSMRRRHSSRNMYRPSAVPSLPVTERWPHIVTFCESPQDPASSHFSAVSDKLSAMRRLSVISTVPMTRLGNACKKVMHNRAPLRYHGSKTTGNTQLYSPFEKAAKMKVKT